MAFDQKRRYHGAVHTAGQRQQNLAVTYLPFNQLNLISYEILHIPVGFRLAGVEDESAQLLLCRHRGQLHLAKGWRMVDGHDRISGIINFRQNIDVFAVHIAMFTAEQNHALYVRRFCSSSFVIS